MPQATANKEYNTFIQGLITEANPLTYPENASIDEENFVLNRDGSRQRRQGIDYEGSYSLSSAITNVNFSEKAVGVTPWRNAANTGLYNFAVVQIGEILHFYDANTSAISANKKSFTVDLNTFKNPYASNIGSELVQTAVGNGYLFVVSKEIEPFFIEYDGDADTITSSQISIKIRDFLGVDDFLDIDENPVSLTNEHKYNLFNQGWDQTKVDAYFTNQGNYPDNTQYWTAGKDSNDNYDTAELVKQYFGNSKAPSGHYILNAFTRDRTTISGISSLTTEIEQGRPSTTAFYAGRVFYSGIESKRNAGPVLNGYVYFSQILNTSHSIAEEAGHCYQSADPTSELISDIIATDGGTIVIPEAGTILKLITLRNSLVVIADNGIWQIIGDADAGFIADGYQIVKITNVGAIGSSTIEQVEGTIIYWSDAGIYVLETDQISGTLSAKNISLGTIQTLYNEISSSSKQYATSSYDPANKRISWLYNGDSTYTGDFSRNKYDTELVLDVSLSAFYKNTISSLATRSPYIAGAFITPSVFSSDIAYGVVHNTDTVQVNGVNVEVSLTNPSSGTTSTKYLTVVPQSDDLNSKVTFSIYNNTTFTDWVTSDGTGVDFVSFLTTGHELLGDTMRSKQAPYIYMHFLKTETGFITSGSDLVLENPSGATLQTRWEFSDSTNSGRWSTSYPVYRFKRNYIPSGSGDTFDYGFEVITTKNKIRGHGNALSMYIASETGKDMQLLGWAITYKGATIV